MPQDIRNLLAPIQEEGVTDADALMAIFAEEAGRENLPSRQKIGDYLSGRRPLPKRIETVLHKRSAEKALQTLLVQAWDSHAPECMWFLKRQEAIRAENADLVARALRKGSVKAWRTARDIERLHEKWMETRSADQ